MKDVEVIYEISDIEKIKIELVTKSFRNYLIFNIGINTGMHTIDILSLRKLDIPNYKFPSSIVKELDRYSRDMKDTDYLFTNEKTNTPIKVATFWRVLHNIGIKIGIGQLGNNSMRKTFGYHLFLKTNDIKLVKKIFHHHSERYTLKFIGIESYSIDKIDDFIL